MEKKIAIYIRNFFAFHKIFFTWCQNCSNCWNIRRNRS